MYKLEFLSNKHYYFTIFILAILYFLAGKVSLLLFNGQGIVSIGVFPSEGIALAFAIFFGKRVCFGVFLGQLVLAIYNGIDLFSSFEIATINAMEAFLGVFLFQKYRLNKGLKNFRDIVGLAIMIVFVLQIFSSLFSNLALLSNSQITKDMFLSSLFSWWFGNVMGQLLFTPFVLLLLVNYKKIKIIEFLLSGLFFGLFFYFLEIVLMIKDSLLLLSITIPFAIFVVSKKGSTYGMLFATIIALMSAYSVYLGYGVKNIIDYNLFVLIHISTVLIASILFEQRRELESNLQKKIEDEISKNKKQQLLMIQQSRLAQMGEMIAMIAHQWRQPLNNLSLANQLLISKYNKKRLDDKAVDYFKKNSKKQIELMSDTINVFRNFFKSEKIKQRFYVNDTIKAILDMTEAIFMTKGIKINLEVQGSFYTFGYPNELGHAILNIINNAKDALMQSDKEDKNINIAIQELGDEILICIEDNAGGIKDDIIGKIFDPYFSTKSSKNGTGLGLYMTKMIIEKKMDGKIAVANKKDGASFKIYLKRDNDVIK